MAAVTPEPYVVGSILLGADQMVGDMVRARIPRMRERQWGPFVAMGVLRRGALIGGVVFHNYQGYDIEFSGAFDDPYWALPGTLRALFSYPFLQLGCSRLTTIQGRKNKRARRLVRGLGFKLEGVHPKGSDGVEDAFSFGMMKEDCRWIKDRNNGQKVATCTAAAA